MSRLSVQCSLLASPDIHTKLVLLKSYNLSMRELIEQRSSGDGRSHESQKGRERPQVQLSVARIATCVPHRFAATSDQNAIRPDRNVGAAGSSLRESTPVHFCPSLSAQCTVWMEPRRNGTATVTWPWRFSSRFTTFKFSFSFLIVCID